MPPNMNPKTENFIKAEIGALTALQGPELRKKAVGFLHEALEEFADYLDELPNQEKRTIIAFEVAKRLDEATPLPQPWEAITDIIFYGIANIVASHYFSLRARYKRLNRRVTEILPDDIDEAIASGMPRRVKRLKRRLRNKTEVLRQLGEKLEG